MSFCFLVETNGHYYLDVSTNLVNWFSVANLICNTQPQLLTFPSTNETGRFFRAWTWP